MCMPRCSATDAGFTVQLVRDFATKTPLHIGTQVSGSGMSGMSVRFLDGVFWWGWGVGGSGSGWKKGVRTLKGQEWKGGGVDRACDPTPAGRAPFEVLAVLPAHSTDDWWHISSFAALHTEADSVPERVSASDWERERKCAKRAITGDKKRKSHFKLDLVTENMYVKDISARSRFPVIRVTTFLVLCVTLKNFLECGNFILQLLEARLTDKSGYLLSYWWVSDDLPL